MKRTGFKSRQTPLAKRSPKRRQVEALDAKAKLACFEKWGSECILRNDIQSEFQHKLIIDPAHIFSKAAYPHLRFEVLNILPLCRMCHVYCHVNPERAMQMLLQKLSPSDRENLLSLARSRR